MDPLLTSVSEALFYSKMIMLMCSLVSVAAMAFLAWLHWPLLKAVVRLVNAAANFLEFHTRTRIPSWDQSRNERPKTDESRYMPPR